MSKTALLTLGRLPKALDIARALKQAGWRVIVAEPFAWHLARLSRSVDVSLVTRAPNGDPHGYLDDLEAIIDRHGVDLVVPVSEEILHVVGLEARLARRTGSPVRLYAPPAADVHRAHDKLAFARLAACLGLAVPDTAPIDDPDALHIARSGRHVVKPALSCSGIGVRLRDIADTEDWRPGDIVQRFLPGEHLSTFAVTVEGTVLRNVVYRGRVFSGTVAVAFERVDDATDVDTWVDRFVAATGWSGFVSFDFIRDTDGSACAVECNPRVTSGVHFLAPEGLAAAIAAPETRPHVGVSNRTRYQQFWPCLTETQASMLRGVGAGSEFRRNLRHLTGSRDVTWATDDPLPLLTMPFTSWTILRRTIFAGETFGEASTRDIALFSGDGPGTLSGREVAS
jgi:hypothetical protein